MKRPLLLAAIICSLHCEAQLPKKFLPLTNQYFVSLPYGLSLQDWIDSLRAMPLIVTDSLFSTDTLRNYYFYGHCTDRFALFPKSDSIGLWVGSTGWRTTASVNGRLVNENLQTVFFLTQIFYFPKDSLQPDEWKEVIKNTIKSLRKFFTVIYPHNDEKNKYQVIWFQNPGEMQPVIYMRYGESEKRKNNYYLWLQLNFSISPSE